MRRKRITKTRKHFNPAEHEAHAVWLADQLKNNPQCFYCRKVLNRSTATTDHATPVSRGGKHEVSNYRLACASCNERKGNKVERSETD